MLSRVMGMVIRERLKVPGARPDCGAKTRTAYETKRATEKHIHTNNSRSLSIVVGPPFETLTHITSSTCINYFINTRLLWMILIWPFLRIPQFRFGSKRFDWRFLKK